MSAQPMTEEVIFAGALEKSTSAEREAYLDSACRGDSGLRKRVESLLKSHDEATGFLGTPAVQIAAEALAGRGGSADTQPEPTGGNDTISLDFLAPVEDPQAIGRIGDYSITEVIGRGGMGIVLKGRDASLDRVVAIKVLAPELASNATARKRFLREAKTAAAVTHQHVVTIHGVGEDRLPYLVMECVSGQSLQDKLDEQGPLELREVLRIGTQIAAGLAAAHANGVIHRDIKPANILLENGIERVRITDFGLARAVDDVSMTRTGEVAGTPQYMSPEQAQGQPLDVRSDLFSFGSVLYAMCTGRPPFRAETTIEAIRRVCDDTPRPIREINAEVPEWLTQIIDRLLAKRPEQRFQTAADVAELLGRHLAHVQDPGSTPFPAITHAHKPGFLEKPGLSRRWVAAAVVLCAVLAGLGVTEATGVSRLTGTVVRIVTGEGTLIIEIDDPTVRVSLDGEELTIAGGGVQELRLRPGQYQFVATRDGRPVKQELITVTRGGERIVTVSREAIEPTIIAPEPVPTRGAFVLLGGTGVAERRFDTLAEAVLGASDGDTIEVRGNGPFFSEPVDIRRTALTIRAGDRFRPVIQLTPEAVPSNEPLVATNAALVLEGLELHRMIPEIQTLNSCAVVRIRQSSLRAANCRFGTPIWANQPHICEFRNCAFLGWEARLGLSHRSGTRVIFENCLVWTTGGAIIPNYDDATLHDASYQIKRSTFVSKPTFLWFVCQIPPPVFSDHPDAAQPIRLEVTDSIFDVRAALGFEQSPTLLNQVDLEPVDAEAALRGLLHWRGERNLFGSGSTSLWWTVNLKQQPPLGPGNLEEWNAFWGTAEANSLEGSIQFHGGNLLSRTGAALDQLTPDDFRLREDSAGYRAGPDGKDLGADVDLVGPGAAYERWKATPEYQEWLEETGQAE